MKSTSRLAACPHFDDRDLSRISRDVDRVLRSGRLILGEETEALEQDFAAKVGTKHAIAVSSCSAALEIALRALKANWREVIVPTNTFVATATSTMRAGSRLVLADCASDGNFGVVEALCRLGGNTAAIIVVHVAGLIPEDLDLLLTECHRRDIAIIEDCAHAHGARWQGRMAGSIGDVGCFSFYPTKVMTCGVGGMITTDRDDVARVARSLRHHGQGRNLEDIVALGSDWLMDEVRAVLCRAQLHRLDEVLGHRRAVARAYEEAISALDDPRIQPPVVTQGTVPAWYKYPLTLPCDAAPVRSKMADLGIETGPLYWPPVHKMPAFESLGAQLRQSEDVLRRRLCLPMHALVDPRDCGEIVGALQKCLD